MRTKAHRFIISGGGTGGHIFPAISIADAIREREPDAEILFIGANGRMEMERVPRAGYAIEGVDVSGFDRSNLLRNIPILFRLGKALWKANGIIRRFAPDAVIGVGGYVSGPTLKIAQLQGIPTIIQEQNSYAGVTNKLLAKKAQLICVAYDKMERFFPRERIRLYGNPVRKELKEVSQTKEEAMRYFGLDVQKKCVLVIGGSLGAKTINDSLLCKLSLLGDQNQLQFIWQTGSRYFDEVSRQVAAAKVTNVHLFPFIDRMELAYKSADLVISRAGASSISELSLLGKTALLIPSPNVAEDHQTKNAMAMVERDAAIMVKDSEARERVVPTMLQLLQDEIRLQSLGRKIQEMGQNESAHRIVEAIYHLIGAK